ncbi:MAG: hypothetical protein OEM05_11600 [Myxococcales bacterium]|nr:hypothetical protein [Myxococcales bacterium]
MKTEKQRPSLSRLLLVVGALAAIGGGAALADYVVGAGEPVVISDDVFDRTTEVISLAGPTGPTSGNDNNRSGLGDDTNSGLGDGTDNSPNEGTLNPNQAPSNRGKKK